MINGDFVVSGDGHLLEPTDDPRVDGRDPRWTTARAVGSDTFIAPYQSRRRGRPRVGRVPPENRSVSP